jgi:hypothetical protein
MRKQNILNDKMASVVKEWVLFSKVSLKGLFYGKGPGSNPT